MYLRTHPGACPECPGMRPQGGPPLEYPSFLLAAKTGIADALRAAAGRGSHSLIDLSKSRHIQMWQSYRRKIEPVVKGGRGKDARRPRAFRAAAGPAYGEDWRLKLTASGMSRTGSILAFHPVPGFGGEAPAPWRIPRHPGQPFWRVPAPSPAREPGIPGTPARAGARQGADCAKLPVCLDWESRVRSAPPPGCT